MNSFRVVIRIPGFWMKILEAVSTSNPFLRIFRNRIFQIFSAVGLCYVFDSYIDIYDINYFNIVFSFLCTYFVLSCILVGLNFKRKPRKVAEKVLLLSGLIWCVLSVYCLLSVFYIGHKTVLISKRSTSWLFAMVSSAAITFLVDLLVGQTLPVLPYTHECFLSFQILSIITVYFIYCTYIEVHSIHTYHMLQCTAFTYFLICGTLITEYVTEETSHFTESMFLIVGIPMHATCATLNLYYYFTLRDSDLITFEFCLSGIFFIITGVLLFVDLLCIIYIDWPRDLRRERNPIRHGWWSGPSTPKREQDTRVSFKEQDDGYTLNKAIE